MDKENQAPPIKSRIKYRRVRTPTVIQMEALECGAACLRMVLGYYGRDIPLEELRVACGVTRDGSSALNIIKAAKSYGLEAKGYRKEIEQLGEMSLPLIAYWGFNHFVVIEGFSKRHVYINDPASGPRAITHTELDRFFTGVIIIFAKGRGFEKTPRALLGSDSLLRRLKTVKGGLLLLTFIGLCLVVPQLALAAFSQVFIDYLLQGKVLWWKQYFMAGMGIVCLLMLGLTLIKQQVLSRLYLKLSLLFSTQFLCHSLFLPLSFFAQRFSGEIASRMALNDRVASALTQVLANGLLNLGIACIFGLSMFYYDSLIASFTIAVVSCNTLLLYFLYRLRQDAYACVEQTAGKSTAYSIGNLHSIETLKATSTESKFFSCWAGYYTRVLNSVQSMGKRDIMAGSAPVFFDNINTMVLLMVGTWRVMEGHLTVGMLLALQILMHNFTAPIFTLLGLMQSIQLLRVDSNRLDDVLHNRIDPAFLEASLDPLSSKKHAPIHKLDGYLEVRNVSFGFNPNADPLLSEINFSLSPGKSIALVGPSGCGKSTIAKLIGGFFEPWGGEILLDGVPRRQLSRNVITSSLAIISQEAALFSETIQDNITLLEAFPVQTDLVQAAKDACIHEDILKRKGGYELLLEKGGGNLSGGQRQRLEIARALYRNPTLLILDEATSALDSGTEAEVIKNIRRRGCTCLMVAHRLSTIKNCDEILVISKGSIIQRGSHEELSELPGLYKTLVKIEKSSGQE